MDGRGANYQAGTLCKQQSQRLPRENRCCTFTSANQSASQSGQAARARLLLTRNFVSFSIVLFFLNSLLVCCGDLHLFVCVLSFLFFWAPHLFGLGTQNRTDEEGELQEGFQFPSNLLTAVNNFCHPSPLCLLVATVCYLRFEKKKQRL